MYRFQGLFKVPDMLDIIYILDLCYLEGNVERMHLPTCGYVYFGST